MDKSKMMMVVIIALLVLLLGTVVGVGVYLINLSDNEPNWIDPQDPATQRELTPGDLRWVYFGAMTANLALSPDGWSDNARLELAVGLNASEFVDEDELEEIYALLNRSVALTRQIASDVLLARTYDQVRTLEGRDEAREATKNALQDAFGSNLIVHVAFNEWLAVPDARSPRR